MKDEVLGCHHIITKKLWDFLGENAVLHLLNSELCIIIYHNIFEKMYKALMFKKNVVK